MKTNGLFLILSFLAVPISCYSNISTPVTPDSWICYTTAGATDEKGGYVNASKCSAGNGGCGGDSLQYVGYIGAVVAVVGFGSNFVPVKKFDTGDGVFFQWILCIGIWLVSVVVNLIRYQPPFFMPVLFGGFLWTTGNIVVVPIIKMIGMTMGLTIWGLTNLLAGWISGRFILKQDLACVPLNYGGLAVIIISALVLALVKSEGKKTESISLNEETPLINSRAASVQGSLSGSITDKLLQGKKTASDTHYAITFNKRTTTPTSIKSDEIIEDEDYSWVDGLGKWPRRICGISLSLAIGFLFGFQFLGVEFMRLCDDDTHSCNELDYVFGHFTGILIASTCWFVIYSVWKRNKPKVYPQVILPALASGILWGIAMVGWFIANEHLSLAVSFPIITTGPGMVSSIWGILVYREIKGWKNIALFIGGVVISLSGQVMVSLSSCVVKC